MTSDATSPAESPRWAALRLLGRVAAPDKHHISRGLCWLLFAAALEAIGPLLGKRFIDSYLLPRHYDVTMMAVLIGGALLSGWVAGILRYLQLIRLAGLAMRSVRRLREDVYQHVLSLPMAFFDRAITGQLVSRVTNDTEAVKTLYVQVLFVMLDNLILLGGAMVAMAWLDWQLMLIVSTLIPAVVVVVWFYQRWSAPAVSKARALRSDINAQMAESIAGMPVLQADNAERRFGERLSQTSWQHYTARMGELRANAWLLRPFLDLMNVLLLVTVIYSFGQRSLSGIEVGVLYAFVSYISRVVEPLIQITLQFSQLQQSIVAAARVNTLISETVHPVSQGQHGITHGQIDIRELSFGYDPAHPVLHDLSLSLPAGSFTGIVGHTGSGKSTLLSLLLRFYQAQCGAILIDGQPLADIDDTLFQRDVGLVPQEPFLLAGSVRDNIDMGRNLDDAAIEQAARAARAHDFIMALESGYATPLGEGGARLATGQKQLLAIARALAGNPRILFLDEATSHIDSETEQIVQETLDSLHGKVTMVAIAHRLSTIRSADHIVVLNHGRLAESGNHDSLMAREGGIYQRLYLLQQLGSNETD